MDFAEYNIPKWDKAGKVHDWRNYISEELRMIWRTFNAHQKSAIADNAEELADAEEWD